MITALTAWWKGVALEAKAITVLAVFVALALLAFLFIHPTKVEAVPAKQEAAATSTAVNVAASETSSEASGDDYVAAAKEKVHDTKSAQDPVGDTGAAGIAALCGLREYKSDSACSVHSANP